MPQQRQERSERPSPQRLHFYRAGFEYVLMHELPSDIPRAQRPRARGPPQAAPAVIFAQSMNLSAMSMNTVPTMPPTIDKNSNSTGHPPSRTQLVRLHHCANRAESGERDVSSGKRDEYRNAKYPDRQPSPESSDPTFGPG